MNSYYVHFKYKSFDFLTRFEAKNLKEARDKASYIIAKDDLIPDSIKENVTKKTVSVKRIYKSK